MTEKPDFNIKGAIAVLLVGLLIFFVFAFTNAGAEFKQTFEKKPGVQIKCDVLLTNPTLQTTTIHPASNCYVIGECLLDKKKVETSLSFTDFGTIKIEFGKYSSTTGYSIGESATAALGSQKTAKFDLEVCTDTKEGQILLFDKNKNVLSQQSDFAE